MSDTEVGDWDKLKRIGRYLKGRPRLLHKNVNELEIFSNVRDTFTDCTPQTYLTNALTAPRVDKKVLIAPAIAEQFAASTSNSEHIYRQPQT